MTEHSLSILERAIIRLLRPVVRLLLKRGIPFSAFAEMAKRAYLEVAEQDFTIEGRKQSASRIAVITGINRKELGRLQKAPSVSDEKENKQFNRAARVIRGWVTDEQFTDHQGNPLTLLFDKDFSDLVRRYSGDMPVRAVLDELLRVGAVQEMPDAQVCLTNPAYIPQMGEPEKLHLLGMCGSDLLDTIEYNLNATTPRYQRFVAYDNIPPEVMEKLRRLSHRQSQAFLEQVNHWLSQYDCDVNPQQHSEHTQRFRAGIGVYYFEQACGERQTDKE